MIDLDHLDTQALDPGDMLGRISELGAQLLDAWDLHEDLELPLAASKATSVVIAGMGGSATAGDYFAALCADSSDIPVSVIRGYRLPNYVNDRSLVLVSSYSGNTEEALSAYDDAWKRGATIIVMTTGGHLAERATADGATVCSFSYSAQPRAAIGHGLGPLLRIGAQLGICPMDRAELQQVVRLHENFVSQLARPQAPAAQNPAKQLAMALHGRIPLILGAEHLAPVASRFKNQVAENGKALAATDTLPEADHNLIVGLATGKAAADALSVVTLESAGYDARTQKRFEVTAMLFEEEGIPTHRILVPGARALEQILLGTAWGDFTSFYLAALNGQDPSPVPQIVRLKAALAG